MIYKRFIVFSWHDYASHGGLRDVEASFDTLAEARECVKRDLEAWDGTQIFDCTKRGKIE